MIQSIIDIFGGGTDPKKMVHGWQKKLRAEARSVDRQVSDIRREELKVVMSIRACAERGDARSAVLLVKEVIASRKATSQLYENKAQMNSVSLMLSEQLAIIKTAGTLKKSSHVLKAMSKLVSYKDMRETMTVMSKEMMKSGLIEEMMSDVFEDASGVGGLEAETSVEMEKVMVELVGEHILPQVAVKPIKSKISIGDGETAMAAIDETKPLRTALLN